MGVIHRHRSEFEFEFAPMSMGSLYEHIKYSNNPICKYSNIKICRKPK